jgi:phage-related protein
LRAQYGDGYMQEVMDGLNAYLRVWTVTWENVNTEVTTKPTLKQLDDFFRANAGLRFLWTQPTPCEGEGAKVFRCKTWQWTYAGGSVAGMQATLEQQPET